VSSLRSPYLLGAFDRTGRKLALVSGEGALELWDPSSAERIEELALLGGQPTALTFSPVGDQLAVAFLDARAVLVELATRQITELPHRGVLTQVAYTPDGQLLVSAGAEGLAIWSSAAGELLARREAPMAEQIVILGGGALLASYHANGMVGLWGLSSYRGSREAAREQVGSLLPRLNRP
jgi:WD40 repeat protein